MPPLVVAGLLSVSLTLLLGLASDVECLTSRPSKR